MIPLSYTTHKISTNGNNDTHVDNHQNKVTHTVTCTQDIDAQFLTKLINCWSSTNLLNPPLEEIYTFQNHQKGKELNPVQNSPCSCSKPMQRNTATRVLNPTLDPLNPQTVIPIITDVESRLTPSDPDP